MTKKSKIEHVLHETQMTAVHVIDDDTEHDPRRGKPDTKALHRLQKSIQRVGLLQSPAIERIDDRYRIVAGRRRLRACKTLIEKGIWPADASIPTIIVDAETAARLRTMAMAENTQREAMHPVDSYEQVRDIMADAGDEREAADALGLSILQVRQFEALGKIAPEIRDAWRAGKIDDSTAKAFTLTDDHTRQVEVYNRLKKGYGLYAHGVRSELGANQHDQIYALAVVGEEAYIKAGGQVRKDLFSDAVIVSDPDLLHRLANDLVTAKCNELVADGWSWALPVASVQNRWSYHDELHDVPVSEAEHAELKTIETRMNEINDKDDNTKEEAEELLRLDARSDEIKAEAFKRACTPELKARTGCLVALGRDGITVNYGLVPPGTPQTAAAGGEPQAQNEENKDAGATISGALLLHLTSELTKAVATIVAEQPNLAAGLLVAGLNSGWRSPVKINSDGLLHREARRTGGGSFLKEIQEHRAMSDMAKAVSTMLDCRLMAVGNKRTAETQAILELIGRKVYEEAAIEVFDAETYFTTASLGRLEEFVAQVNELRKATLGDKIELLATPKGKKADKAAWAAARAKEIGWLPPELRYDCDDLDIPREIPLHAGNDDDEDGDIEDQEIDDEQDDDEAA